MSTPVWQTKNKREYLFNAENPKSEAEAAVDYFKRTILGEPEPHDLLVHGLNYKEPVLWVSDLPTRGRPGDIIEVKSEGKHYVWNKDKWEPVEYPGVTKASPVTISIGSSVSHVPTLDCGQGLEMTGSTISLDASLHKIIEKSQQEIEELRKEIHELKSRASYAK